MIDRLRGRQELQFFRALRRAAPAYATHWWVLVVLRGTLPAVTSVAFGWLVSAITRDVSLVGPLVMVGADREGAFVLAKFVIGMGQVKLGVRRIAAGIAART